MNVKNGAGVLYVPKHARDPVTRQRNTDHPDCQHGFIFYEGYEFGKDVYYAEGKPIPIRYFAKDGSNTFPALRTLANSELTDANDLIYDRFIPQGHIEKYFNSLVGSGRFKEKLEVLAIQGVIEKWVVSGEVYE